MFAMKPVANPHKWIFCVLGLWISLWNGSGFAALNDGVSDHLQGVVMFEAQQENYSAAIVKILKADTQTPNPDIDHQAASHDRKLLLAELNEY